MKLLKLIVLGSVLATTGILSANYYLGDTAFAGDNSSSQCITKEEIRKAQETWGQAIVAIGEASKNGKDAAKKAAEETINNLYAYDNGGVLFKPTLASEQQFRSTKDEALSYFVGAEIVEKYGKEIEGIEEDAGFALRPWSKVRFENAESSLNCQTALAMGNYFFTDGNNNKEIKVEYTFGYKKNKDGKLEIILQHSSLPFTPPSK